MLDVDRIVKLKLKYRLERSDSKPNAQIIDMVNNCCKVLNLVFTPNIMFCDSLVKNFNTFYIQNQPFILIDYSLIECLYIFNAIIISNVKKSDIIKFYNKILCEELIYNNSENIVFFYEKYKKDQFSFSDDIDVFDKQVKDCLFYQIYFLLVHELSHLAIKQGTRVCSYDDYNNFFFEALNFILKNSSSKILKNKKWDKNDNKIQALIEECYCDYNAFCVLIDANDTDKSKSLEYSYCLMNFLITYEMIRNSIEEGLFRDFLEQEATDMFFYLHIRLNIFTVTLLLFDDSFGNKLRSKCDYINDVFKDVLRSLCKERVVGDIILINNFEMNKDLKEEIIQKLRYKMK